jgi:hypothetical protein
MFATDLSLRRSCATTPLLLIGRNIAPDSTPVVSSQARSAFTVERRRGSNPCPGSVAVVESPLSE